MKKWSICVALCAVFLPRVDGLAQEFKGNPVSGQAVYRDYCLRCHGEALDGKGPEASSLNSNQFIGFPASTWLNPLSKYY